MKKSKDEFVTKLAEEMQLPLSALRDTFRIELRGNGEMFVEGCSGIVEYDENNITLSLRSNSVAICGFALEITSFSECQAVITGKITSVTFAVTGG